jgi:hypothetical protein
MYYSTQRHDLSNLEIRNLKRNSKMACYIVQWFDAPTDKRRYVANLCQKTEIKNVWHQDHHSLNQDDTGIRLTAKTLLKTLQEKSRDPYVYHYSQPQPYYYYAALLDDISLEYFKNKFQNPSNQLIIIPVEDSFIIEYSTCYDKQTHYASSFLEKITAGAEMAKLLYFNSEFFLDHYRKEIKQYEEKK